MPVCSSLTHGSAEKKYLKIYLIQTFIERKVNAGFPFPFIQVFYQGKMGSSLETFLERQETTFISDLCMDRALNSIAELLLIHFCMYVNKMEWSYCE